MNKPLISVLIPAYKKNWIEIAILSVLYQTEQDFEIIICDDRNDHDIFNIIKKWLNDPRIKYIKNPIKDGVGYNCHEELIKHAKGKYIKFLHDDDYLAPNSLKILSSMLENNNRAKMAFHHRAFVDEFGSVYAKPVFLSGDGSLELSREQFFDLYIARNPYNLIGEVSNVMFDTLALQSVENIFELNGRKTRYYGDVTIYLNFMVHNKTSTIMASTEFGSYYRQSEAKDRNSSLNAPILIYRFFEREYIRRWCGDNNLITRRQARYLKIYQEYLYLKLYSAYPELLDLLNESKNNENHTNLNQEFNSIVRKIDDKYTPEIISSYTK